MCIAIYKPGDKEITKETLKICYEANSDGCGFAYLNKDVYGKIKIKTHKTMDFDKFYTMYQRALNNNPDSPFIIHFRIATHGTVDEFNCHPFKVSNQLAFIHNGIINSAPKCPDGKRSDTQMFNHNTLRNLPNDFLENEATLELIEDYIGYSKLVFLRDDGVVVICNEQKGEWSDGIWFSNSSYKPKKYVYQRSHNGYPYNNNNTTNKTKTPATGSGVYGDTCVLGGKTHYRCASCDAWHPWDEVIDVYMVGAVESLCKDCYKKLEDEDVAMECIFDPYDESTWNNTSSNMMV